MLPLMKERRKMINNNQYQYGEKNYLNYEKRSTNYILITIFPRKQLLKRKE